MMNVYLRKSVFVLFLLCSSLANSQVLISLIFGESLNTPNIEFGLQGGFNRSYINTISEAKGVNNFNLGFYFHILMKNNSYLGTGVMVKSQVGATGMPTYSLGDEDFDEVYKDAVLTKKIPTFYVPILFHQRFNNRWYIEIGPQLGLIHKPKDIFETTALDGDLTYTRGVKDEYKYIDVGFVGGVGYKFKKKVKSTAVGISYYQGFADVSDRSDISIVNSSLNFYIKIPIGLGKEKEKEKEKE